MKTVKKILIPVLVVVVIAVGIYLFATRSKAPQKMSYKTTEVRRGSIVNTVTATGTIEPIIQVEVGTQVSGIIEHFPDLLRILFHICVACGKVLHG